MAVSGRPAGGRCHNNKKPTAPPATTAIKLCRRFTLACLDTGTPVFALCIVSSARIAPQWRQAKCQGLTAAVTILLMLEPSTPVQFVKGIGPKLSEILANKDIRTVDDLLHYLPFRYEDRQNPRGIAELQLGEMATLVAEVRTSGLFRTRRMPIFQLTVGQGRSRLKCIWFNGTYLKDKFQPGQLVALYGKVD